VTAGNIAVSPTQWGSLKDITDIPPLGAEDQSCLNDLYAVLKKHGKAERFGIMLAHKHFDLADDETLLEFTDPETRTLTITTVKKGCEELAHSIQTSWLLCEGDDHQVVTECFNSCWTDVQGNHNRTHRRGS
jgi:hypothetical protein